MPPSTRRATSSSTVCTANGQCGQPQAGPPDVYDSPLDGTPRASRISAAAPTQQGGGVAFGLDFTTLALLVAVGLGYYLYQDGKNRAMGAALAAAGASVLIYRHLTPAQ